MDASKVGEDFELGSAQAMRAPMGTDRDSYGEDREYVHHGDRFPLFFFGAAARGVLRARNNVFQAQHCS